MRTLQNTQSNDIFLSPAGSLVVLEGARAVAQDTRTAMQSQRGEMVFQVDDGLPTDATVWARFEPRQFEAAARTVIEAVPGVVSIPDFTATAVAGGVSYTATIETEYGAITWQP